MTSKKKMGRPAGIGVNIEMLANLKVGDSIEVDVQTNDAAILQAARNRFYNPARRLGIKLSYEVANNKIRIKREA